MKIDQQGAFHEQGRRMCCMRLCIGDFVIAMPTRKAVYKSAVLGVFVWDNEDHTIRVLEWEGREQFKVCRCEAQWATLYPERTMTFEKKSFVQLVRSLLALHSLQWGRCIEEPEPCSTRELVETIIEHYGYHMYEEGKWTSYGYAPIIYALGGPQDQPGHVELGRLDKLLGFYPRTLEESVTRMLAAADQMDDPQTPDAGRGREG
jgi:hypothetical protein